MNVLIIGAGRRGLRIAQHLVSEGASIVFLDRNAARCQIAEAKLDCLAVNGSGTDLEKLRDAGAGTVDTVISATDSDEVNIVSCGIIASAFPNVENTTAVIRSSGYLGDQELPHKILGITHLINPDLEGALRIVDTVRYGLYQDTIIFPGTDFILFTVLGLRAAVRLLGRDDFQGLLCVGITIMIVSQVVLNIAVVTGLLPPTGIPLPFFSQGGTNLFIILFECGLLYRTVSASSKEVAS